MRWVDALKVFNQGKSSWCIPKKGSKEHAEVMEIMSKPAKPTKIEPAKIKITQTGYRVKTQTKEEQDEEKKKEREKMLKSIKYADDNWKDLKPDEKIDVYVNLETLSLPIPKVMKRSYDNWVKNKRPSSLRGTSGRVPNTAYDKQQRKGQK
jgi:hypothetical protein